ncbi:hypothetical protein Kpol_478p22 [Vanderwaltozyma polyspora DSM 70294]|uniref:BAR domain-containing protein n=1 Tax=Vanderwaltozyma polyspora (strain ATCC 22028 / DSM 70294 / BCRC 21397 / CBS 2163 / NBRC 10782 / NRRL Y-8283 / UCD 57-17) TaxID=436907 RepID=A7TPP1_VANPO|nr:uncharacterized protein Kpol_478p22 [Vanderwaltozyma polyspora DSM 70294]EDO15786.1 hypothetical protein Kpol_478p22 [Vanderwaltozyma polyspora DSM 70294]
MSFGAFSESVGKKFQELTTKTQELTSTIPTVAQSTHRMVKEKLGQVDDISPLPQEYLDLELKIDTYKSVYEHFLKITSIYERESYDYPKEFSESVNEFTDSIGNKMYEFSNGVSTEGSSGKTPRTLNYAVSKVSMGASEQFQKLHDTDDKRIANLLTNVGNAEASIAEARLLQDHSIQAKFNFQLREEIAQSIERASKYRKEVYHKRLKYDIAREKYSKHEKNGTVKVELEILEDEFNHATKDAIMVMQEIISNNRFEQNLKDFAAAKLAYHEKSVDALRNLLDNAELASEKPVPETPATKTEQSKDTPVSTNNKVELEVNDDEEEEDNKEIKEEKPKGRRPPKGEVDLK